LSGFTGVGIKKTSAQPTTARPRDPFAPGHQALLALSAALKLSFCVVRFLSYWVEDECEEEIKQRVANLAIRDRFRFDCDPGIVWFDSVKPTSDQLFL
jgi:hypothetical protein